MAPRLVLSGPLGAFLAGVQDLIAAIEDAVREAGEDRRSEIEAHAVQQFIRGAADAYESPAPLRTYVSLPRNVI